ncbi:MAG TPA: FHA domain-containing protein [Actinomycetota bacterium]|nr:FHA domain-containing protein [Actinomycetota bacterium]
MPDIVLVLLKYAFLAVLYIFIARVVKAVYVELRPGATATTAAAPRSSARRAKKAPRKAAVIEGNPKGKVLELGDELVIGRAEKCHLVIDDTYVSQLHARIFGRGDSFVVEDLGSTNGTYVNRRRITAPTELQRGDRVKIGKTVLEMRK